MFWWGAMALHYLLWSHHGYRDADPRPCYGGNGAAFCKEFPPQELISLTTHETLDAAMCAEVANCNLWYGKLRDYRRVKGGRLNMVGDPPHAPRGYNVAEGNTMYRQQNIANQERDGEESGPTA